MGKSVDLQKIFLDIPDEIKFTFPCAERHLDLLIMTYADFDRKYLIFKKIYINKIRSP
jgi:hypothetical protein